MMVCRSACRSERKLFEETIGKGSRRAAALVRLDSPIPDATATLTSVYWLRSDPFRSQTQRAPEIHVPIVNPSLCRVWQAAVGGKGVSQNWVNWIKN